MMNKDLRKNIGGLLRAGICVGLLLYLLSRIDRGSLGTVFSLSLTHWPWVALGVGMTFAGLVIGALRWKIILDAQHLSLPLWRVVQIFFIGQFFNAFMLGACGGDVARAYYVTRETPAKKTEAAATVFVDRAIGLFALIVFCCVMIALRIPLFLDHTGPRHAGFLMALFLLLSLAGIGALFYRNLFEHLAFFRAIEDRTRAGPLIRRTYEAFYLYRKQHRTLLFSLLLSLLNLVFLNYACQFLGNSLEVNASSLDYFTLFPIISVIAAIPITPGSLGVRESLFVTLFEAIDVQGPQAMLLSLMVYAGSLVWSLFGWLMLVSYTSDTGGSVREELDALKKQAEQP